jgi:shikimate dehydrogenase
MRQFGLIGYPLSHSFSKKYFAEKFEKEGLTDCSYDSYPISSINQLTDLIADHPFLKGLNVTIPYKEQVLTFLDVVSPEIQEIGACNCIAIQNGRLTGYNTDVKGFGNSLTKKLQPHHTHALILGTGGAAKAVAWVLKQFKIEYKYVSRNASENDNIIGYNKIDEDVLLKHTLLINTTPLGMYPAIDDCPAIPYQYITKKHFLFDLIYNPVETIFLKKGRLQGALVENGMEMLTIQAEESWKIWNASGQ